MSIDDIRDRARAQMEARAKTIEVNSTRVKMAYDNMLRSNDKIS